VPDDQESKSIALEAAQLAIKLHPERSQEQIKQIAKEAAQEAVCGRAGSSVNKIAFNVEPRS
jgi:hypothetical protein